MNLQVFLKFASNLLVPLIHLLSDSLIYRITKYSIEFCPTYSISGE